ncbi:MAG: helix-hairpin-helix domain-containing protein [Actinomycetota bacterium]|nr:helix-hairpin-helix domain-containing protein [Actinomycetota bacterium]
MTEPQHDLTQFKVHGIGTASIEHLRKTGITTVEQLAQLNPSRLQAKLKPARHGFTAADARSVISAARELLGDAAPPVAPDPEGWTALVELGVAIETRAGDDDSLEWRLCASTEGVEEPLEVAWPGLDLERLAAWISMLVESAAGQSRPLPPPSSPAGDADARPEHAAGHERASAGDGAAVARTADQAETASPAEGPDSAPVTVRVVPSGRDGPEIRLPGADGAVDVPDEIDLVVELADGEPDDVELVGVHDFVVGANRRRFLRHARPDDGIVRLPGIRLDAGEHRLELVLSGARGAHLVDLDVVFDVSPDVRAQRSEPSP